MAKDELGRAQGKTVFVEQVVWLICPVRNSVLRIVSLSCAVSVQTSKKQTLPKCSPTWTPLLRKFRRQSLPQARSRMILGRTPALDQHRPSLTIHRSRLEIIPLSKQSLGSVSNRSICSVILLNEHTAAMVCRVCLGSVKKNAVICDQCSLISHAKCAPDAAPTCDLRSQLLLYAQFAEKGNINMFHNSQDSPNASTPSTHTPVVPSEVSFVTPSPRQGADLTSFASGLPPKPPAAFKIIHGFGRSRSSLSVSNPSASASPNLAANRDDKIPARKSSKLRHSVERPHSESSNSTGPKSIDTVDSQSSRQEPRRSVFSIMEPDTDTMTRASQRASGSATSSKITSNGGSAFEKAQQNVPGTLSGDPDRQKKRNGEKQSNCVLQ